MKILIVDDSKAMQQIVKRGLEKLGYDDLEIVLASSGVAALKLAKEWKPKLILSGCLVIFLIIYFRNIQS